MSAVGDDPVSAESVVRLHALLVEAVRERRGADPGAAPVTVAEIYQELVPYRGVRAALGLELNADYEYALLRLLSGEGGLARVEPAAARDQLERELASPNPNVTLYRKFAGCDVWLQPAAAGAPDWVSEHLAESAAEAIEPPEPASSPAGEATAMGAARARQPEQVRQMTTEQGKTRVAAPAAAPAEATAAEEARCPFCDSALPAGRTVRFCPYCGQDQNQRPCSVCAEPLQADWAFCIACGGAATGDA